jgi:hypothetical protein
MFGRYAAAFLQAGLALAVIGSAQARQPDNLICNPGFEQRDGNAPAGFELTGGAEYRFMGETTKDSSIFRRTNHPGPWLAWSTASKPGRANGFASPSAGCHRRILPSRMTTFT